jgi:hypothetical protein
MSASLLADLVDYLATQASLVKGTSLFLGSLPEGSGLATAIVPTGGASRPYSVCLAATFQVLTRGADAGLVTPLARAWAIYDALYPSRLPRRNVMLSTEWKLVLVDAIQPPADAGLNEAGRRIVSWNFQVKALKRSA